MTTKIEGIKLNMSQIFLDSGKVIPVTVVGKIDLPLSSDMENSSVEIIGKSKGKGFAGVMKKWHFTGGEATRGQSTKPRAPGSIGSQTPGRVRKGKKMAGRMGAKKVTVKGLRIARVFADKKEIMISGPVPGSRNSKVTIILK